ncbi:hypothetical protein PENTCL1PPCAC_23650, partial [Pristionchus entomophagus]
GLLVLSALFSLSLLSSGLRLELSTVGKDCHTCNKVCQAAQIFTTNAELEHEQSRLNDTGIFVCEGNTIDASKATRRCTTDLVLHMVKMTCYFRDIDELKRLLGEFVDEKRRNAEEKKEEKEHPKPEATDGQKVWNNIAIAVFALIFLLIIAIAVYLKVRRMKTLATGTHQTMLTDEVAVAVAHSRAIAIVEDHNSRLRTPATGEGPVTPAADLEDKTQSIIADR